MNEWFKNMIEKAKGFWKGASIIKKVIVVGIAVALIALVCVAVNVNGSDSTVRVFPQPVTDETKRDQILVQKDFFLQIMTDLLLSITVQLQLQIRNRG